MFSMKIWILSVQILIFSMKILDFLYEKSWWIFNDFLYDS